jgi:hypothetical protein
MSHIVSIPFQCRSLDAVRAACGRLGSRSAKGRRPTDGGADGRATRPLPDHVRVEDLGKCHHAIKVPGVTYEVGIVANADGSYDLRWDYFDNALCVAMGGQNADKFRQTYQIEVARIEARPQGRAISGVSPAGRHGQASDHAPLLTSRNPPQDRPSLLQEDKLRCQTPSHTLISRSPPRET